MLAILPSYAVHSLMGRAAVGEVRELGGRDAERLGQFKRASADLGRDLVEGRFYGHAGLHADQHQIQRIGKRPLDRLLAALDEVGDEQIRQIETEIGRAH